MPSETELVLHSLRIKINNLPDHTPHKGFKLPPAFKIM